MYNIKETQRPPIEFFVPLDFLYPYEILQGVEIRRCIMYEKHLHVYTIHIRKDYRNLAAVNSLCYIQIRQ